MKSQLVSSPVAGGGRSGECPAHAVGQHQVQRRGDPGCDACLHREDVGNRRVELLAPPVARRVARLDLDQLRPAPHPARRARAFLPLHRSRQQVSMSWGGAATSAN